MAEREYYRLTRARRRPGVAVITVSQYSLWLGWDHLLLAESNGYSESYKRFYFRGIQAIIVHRTSARRTINLVWGALATPVILIILAAINPPAYITVGIALLTVVLPLSINSLLGPTCRCQVR